MKALLQISCPSQPSFAPPPSLLLLAFTLPGLLRPQSGGGGLSGGLRGAGAGGGGFQAARRALKLVSHDADDGADLDAPPTDVAHLYKVCVCMCMCACALVGGGGLCSALKV